MHYLDNAATTRVLPEAAEAAVHAMCEEFGNPSSLHRMGLEASHLLEGSRRTVASALGCLPEEVYFTACGTESTNISLRGAAHLNRHKKGRIITTEIEHAATVNTAKQLAADGFDVVFLPAGQQRDRHGTAGRTARKAAQGQGTQGAVPY